MKAAGFEYHAPSDLSQTIELLSSLSNAKVLAGGQSLVPMMNFRLAIPDHLVDINGLTGLRGIRIDADTIEIGAMTRHRDLELSQMLREACPLLTEAMPHVGHRQTRNRGTIGGSLAHADPAAEIPAVVLTLDGHIEAQGPNGARSVPMSEFAVGLQSTVLRPDEVVTAVSLPRWPTGHGHAFVEFARQRGGFALAAAASLIELGNENAVRRVAVTLAGVGPVPVRLLSVERTLQGQKIDRATIADAVAGMGEIEATADVHASAAYRTHLARVLAARAIFVAHERAQRDLGRAP